MVAVEPPDVDAVESAAVEFAAVESAVVEFAAADSAAWAFSPPRSERHAQKPKQRPLFCWGHVKGGVSTFLTIEGLL